MLSPEKIEQIFTLFHAAESEPKTELNAPNPFCLLIAIVLSAQATDVGVNKATKALFAHTTTPQAFLDLGLDGLIPYIKTIGLYQSKGKHIIALCERLVTVYDGEIPHTREALQTLAGVGRKTANVWLNCVLGLPTIAVDTHVQRVANRIGLCTTTTPEHTEAALEKVIPAHWMQHAHHWLILHGRYTCKARSPMCYNCRIAHLCQFPEKTKHVQTPRRLTAD
jgi:endonuclease-3